MASALDLSNAPDDIITMLLGHMDIKQRFRCALVCSEWAKAAAGATRSIVKHDMRHEMDLAHLQQWVGTNGSQVETLHLQGCRFILARLPCAQLQDFQVHGYTYPLPNLDSRVWGHLAAATKLTSVSFKDVSTTSRQANVVSALTALPDLQHLTWHWLTCDSERELSDSRLLQQLTKLTGLELCCVAEKALQHLRLLSKLQHLHMHSPWAAANFPGLQELTGLTSLALYYSRRQLPASISRLTALQQLKVSSASASELDSLMRLTALTKLHVWQLTSQPKSLQLAALRHLQLTGLSSLPSPVIHISALSGCSQLQKLSLQSLCLTRPGSLAACSMLQELDLNCTFGTDSGPASLSRLEAVFPGPGQLQHLTSLVLQSVCPLPEHALLVACCSCLQALQYGTRYWNQVFPNTSAFKA